MVPKPLAYSLTAGYGQALVEQRLENFVFAPTAKHFYRDFVGSKDMFEYGGDNQIINFNVSSG